jgi:catechol 2,3-dioxygenase-like lactoylglutathione lyase family enzyme
VQLKQGCDMTTSEAPVLAGVHHLKLPVSDLNASLAWYQSRLGYRTQIEFTEDGRLMGVAMTHPAGGPDLALRLAPGGARAAAGFDYFAIGVPHRDALERLAGHLDGLGQQHAGVHRASFGWILPEVLDPDGHALRFYTVQHHTEVSDDAVSTINDPRESAERAEALAAGKHG